MYISNYILPLEMIKRLNSLLEPFNRKIINFLENEHPVEDSIEFLLHEHAKSTDSNSYQLMHYDDARKLLTKCKGEIIGFKYNHKYILTDANKPAWNYSRLISELEPADYAVLLRCLRLSEHNGSVLLHYNDIGMRSIPPVDNGYLFDIYNGILRECRSVIINLATLEIESLPFYKFFNMGEREDYMREEIVNRIKNSTYTEFTDKLDGSFIQVTRKNCTANNLSEDSQQLTLSSSNTLIPDGNEHIKYAINYINANKNEKIYELCCYYPELTFMFEMIYPPIDAHLVEYPKEKWGLHLIGARNKLTGEILRYNELKNLGNKFNIRITSFFEDMTLEEAQEICRTYSAAEREGFVANIDGFLVKIKLDDFCSTLRIVNGASFNKIMEATVNNSFDDMISKIPEAFRKNIEDNYQKIINYNEQMDETIKEIIKKVPSDCPIKESIEWINNNVPSEWRGYIISGFKKGLDSLPEFYLGKNIGSKNASLMNERQFREAMEIIDNFKELKYDIKRG